MKKVFTISMIVLLAMFLCGCAESNEEIYEKGVSAFQSGDYALAVDCYQQSAKMGFGKAYLALGFMYEDGLGVEQSDRKAFEHFYEADLNREPLGTFKTGLCYLDGRGVPRNELMGIDFVSKAAEWGLDVAKDFCDSHGIPYDHLKAAQNSSY